MRVRIVFDGVNDFFIHFYTFLFYWLEFFFFFAACLEMVLLLFMQFYFHVRSNAKWEGIDKNQSAGNR